jgi:hypothetical protein
MLSFHFYFISGPHKLQARQSDSFYTTLVALLAQRILVCPPRTLVGDEVQSYSAEPKLFVTIRYR